MPSIITENCDIRLGHIIAAIMKADNVHLVADWDSEDYRLILDGNHYTYTITSDSDVFVFEPDEDNDNDHKLTIVFTIPMFMNEDN